MEASDKERLAVLETQMENLTRVLDEVRAGQTEIAKTQGQLLVAFATDKGKWAGVALVASGLGIVLSIAKEWILHLIK